MVRTGTPPARSQRKRTSTLVIQARAGVSRGRLLHHFPSREELLVAAVQHLASHRLKQTEDRVATLLAGEPEGPQRADRCVELLWATFQEPHFWAAMELWTAARTSPALAAALRPEERRLREAIRGVADRIWGPAVCAHPRYHELCALLFTSMRGRRCRTRSRIVRPPPIRTWRSGRRPPGGCCSRSIHTRHAHRGVVRSVVTRSGRPVMRTSSAWRRRGYGQP